MAASEADLEAWAAMLAALAPELSCEVTPQTATLFNIADSLTGKDAFGDKRALAVVLRTAHIMTLAKMKGQGGSVTTKKEGDLMVQFASPMSTDAKDLCTTSYGTMLDGMIRNIFCASITGACDGPNRS